MVSIYTQQGYIYRLTSPSGKSYIGQTVKFLRSGRKKGISTRWLQHCNCAKRNPDEGSRVLNHAINKYGPENFKVEELLCCNVNDLDFYETKFIDEYNTLVPNGYNLQVGGTFTKHSDETCKKRSASMKKLLRDPKKRLIWREAKLGKRGKKRKCKKAINNGLPKYIYFRESHGGKYKGYVVDHPNGTKRFGKQKYSLEKNLTLAMEYVKSIE